MTKKQMVKCVMAGSRFVMMVISVWKNHDKEV